MKCELILAILFAAVFGIIHSCTISDSEFQSDSSKDKVAVNEQGLATRGNSELYSVSPEDIEAYIHYKTLAIEKDTLVVKSVIPFPSEDDFLCYVINYEDNWEMISSDKRTAAVIAKGEGEFDPSFETNKSIAWLSCLAEEIKVLKTTDEETKNSDKYQMFWKLITADECLFNKTGEFTRSGPDTLYHPVPGHYELYDVESEEVIVAFKDHLIHTKWGQGSQIVIPNSVNYNDYCPIDSSYYDAYLSYPIYYSSYENYFPHCLAGCVAVAGGQIVKYYHDMGNDGAEPYRYASCYTREDPYTDYDAMLQWNKSSSNWVYFNQADSVRMAAVMLANIGKGCLMHYYGKYFFVGNQLYYQDVKSTTTLDALQPVLLSEYDTDSYLFGFNGASFNLYDYIEDLLSNNYPSILDATNSAGGNRHAFIVDSYKQSYTTNTYYYQFIPDDPSWVISIESIDYHFNTPNTTYFRMNWGDYGNGDDIWCVKSGDWYDGLTHFSNRITLMTFDTSGDPPGNEVQSIPHINSL